MKAATLALALAIAGCLNGCNARDDSPNPVDQPVETVVRETAIERVDPVPARLLLLRYFDAVRRGQEDEAQALWCDPSAAAQFARSLAQVGDYEVNVAEPLADGSGAYSISLQLLAPDQANLADGSALLEPGLPGSSEEWCIRRVALQPPPVPLPNLET